jgi:PST family polysaccharide transporter
VTATDPDRSTPGGTELRAAAARGIGWSALQATASRLLSAVVFVLLARLLEPDAFGVVAVASVFVAFMTVLVDQGFSQALVQRSSLDKEHLDTAFWANLGASAVVVALVMGAAGPVAALFDEPDLAPILRILSLALVAGALEAVPAALLRRRLAFASLAVRGLLSIAAGGVAGVAAALAGLGAWSLVIQLLVQAVVEMAVVWSAVDWRPGRSVSWASAKDLLTFGASVTGTSLVNFLNRRSDDFLIGLVLGSTALGLYTVAYKLLLLMTDVLTRTIEVVAFPVFSRVQDDPPRFVRGFYAANRASLAVATPAYLFVAAFSPEVVEVAFGPSWSDSAPVLRALAFIGILQASLLFNATLVGAAGRPDLALLVTTVNGVANVVAFALVVSHGILAVAVAYVVVGYLLAPLSLWSVRKVLPYDVWAYLRLYVPPLVGSAVAIGPLLVAEAALGGQLSALPRLVLAGTVAPLLYVATMRVAFPATAAELWSFGLDALPGRRRRATRASAPGSPAGLSPAGTGTRAGPPPAPGPRG